MHQTKQEEEDTFGPKPIAQKQAGKFTAEGEAMINFIKQNKRIPRRGEIGRTAEEIAQYESIGFVMSGSRNKKMTAARIAKESQVYSSEERRIIDELKEQSKEKRENELIANLRMMVDRQSKEKKKISDFWLFFRFMVQQIKGTI